MQFKLEVLQMFFLDQSMNIVAHANIWICSDFRENNMERFALTLWTSLVINKS